MTPPNPIIEEVLHQSEKLYVPDIIMDKAKKLTDWYDNQIAMPTTDELLRQTISIFNDSLTKSISKAIEMREREIMEKIRLLSLPYRIMEEKPIHMHKEYLKALSSIAEFIKLKH
jgi:hypothetical protein